MGEDFGALSQVTPTPREEVAKKDDDPRIHTNRHESRFNSQFIREDS
jgi:hypothetical protein